MSDTSAPSGATEKIFCATDLKTFRPVTEDISISASVDEEVSGDNCDSAEEKKNRKRDRAAVSETSFDGAGSSDEGDESDGEDGDGDGGGGEGENEGDGDDSELLLKKKLKSASGDGVKKNKPRRTKKEIAMEREEKKRKAIAKENARALQEQEKKRQRDKYRAHRFNRPVPAVFFVPFDQHLSGSRFCHSGYMSISSGVVDDELFATSLKKVLKRRYGDEAVALVDETDFPPSAQNIIARGFPHYCCLAQHELFLAAFEKSYKGDDYDRRAVLEETRERLKKYVPAQILAPRALCCELFVDGASALDFQMIASPLLCYPIFVDAVTEKLGIDWKIVSFDPFMAYDKRSEKEEGCFAVLSSTEAGRFAYSKHPNMEQLRCISGVPIGSCVAFEARAVCLASFTNGRRDPISMEVGDFDSPDSLLSRKPVVRTANAHTSITAAMLSKTLYTRTLYFRTEIEELSRGVVDANLPLPNGIETCPCRETCRNAHGLYAMHSARKMIGAGVNDFTTFSKRVLCYFTMFFDKEDKARVKRLKAEHIIKYVADEMRRLDECGRFAYRVLMPFLINMDWLSIYMTLGPAVLIKYEQRLDFPTFAAECTRTLGSPAPHNVFFSDMFESEAFMRNSRLVDRVACLLAMSPSAFAPDPEFARRRETVNGLLDDLLVSRRQPPTGPLQERTDRCDIRCDLSDAHRALLHPEFAAASVALLRHGDVDLVAPRRDLDCERAFVDVCAYAFGWDNMRLFRVDSLERMMKWPLDELDPSRPTLVLTFTKQEKLYATGVVAAAARLMGCENRVVVCEYEEVLSTSTEQFRSAFVHCEHVVVLRANFFGTSRLLRFLILFDDRYSPESARNVIETSGGYARKFVADLVSLAIPPSAPRRQRRLWLSGLAFNYSLQVGTTPGGSPVDDLYFGAPGVSVSEDYSDHKLWAAEALEFTADNAGRIAEVANEKKLRLVFMPGKTSADQSAYDALFNSSVRPEVVVLPPAEAGSLKEKVAVVDVATSNPLYTSISLGGQRTRPALIPGRMADVVELYRALLIVYDVVPSAGSVFTAKDGFHNDDRTRPLDYDFSDADMTQAENYRRYCLCRLRATAGFSVGRALALKNSGCKSIFVYGAKDESVTARWTATQIAPSFALPPGRRPQRQFNGAYAWHANYDLGCKSALPWLLAEHFQRNQVAQAAHCQPNQVAQILAADANDSLFADSSF